MKILGMLSGYKTYFAALMIFVMGIKMMIAGDLAGGFTHILSQPEFMDGLKMALEALGLGGLRHGVSKGMDEIRQYLDYKSIVGDD